MSGGCFQDGALDRSVRMSGSSEPTGIERTEIVAQRPCVPRKSCRPWVSCRLRHGGGLRHIPALLLREINRTFAGGGGHGHGDKLDHRRW